MQIAVPVILQPVVVEGGFLNGINDGHGDGGPVPGHLMEQWGEPASGHLGK